MPRPHYQALLVDLDGTLLEIDMDRFIAVYMQRLAHSFTDYTAPEQFAAHLLGATGAMVRSADPVTINETVFFDDFCRRIGQPHAAVRPVFDRFYETEFPHLKPCSNPRPHAGAVVESARGKGLKLALATNPIFPRIAVEHRLAWTGLSGDDFDLITTVENMHYCKPKLEYYLETAKLLDCPPALCLMAGNDVQEDLAAAAVGMDTFMVDDFLLHRRKEEEPLCTYRGSLKNLVDFIEALDG
ncbi:MAG: HAD family hydrolase [Bacillota bacterium]